MLCRMEGSPSEIIRPGPDSLTADKLFYLCCYFQFPLNRIEKKYVYKQKWTDEQHQEPENQQSTAAVAVLQPDDFFFIINSGVY